ncbi:MAG: hypothetical protein Q7T26_02640 [Dehalococcoidia bacterium]|nr:hypothetical protein [Dehalococcoidia bacterium]
MKKRIAAKGDAHDNERDDLEREAARTDREIDGVVYDLYGLTEAERKLVEGETAAVARTSPLCPLSACGEGRMAHPAGRIGRCVRVGNGADTSVRPYKVRPYGIRDDGPLRRGDSSLRSE